MANPLALFDRYRVNFSSTWNGICCQFPPYVPLLGCQRHPRRDPTGTPVRGAVTRRSGFRWHFVLDLRDEALRRIIRLSGWIFFYVGVNQVGYVVVILLANRARGGYKPEEISKIPTEEASLASDY